MSRTSAAPRRGAGARAGRQPRRLRSQRPGRRPALRARRSTARSTGASSSGRRCPARRPSCPPAAAADAQRRRARRRLRAVDRQPRDGRPGRHADRARPRARAPRASRPTPTPSAAPLHAAMDADGDLWVTLSGVDKLVAAPPGRADLAATPRERCSPRRPAPRRARSRALGAGDVAVDRRGVVWTTLGSATASRGSTPRSRGRHDRRRARLPAAPAATTSAPPFPPEPARAPTREPLQMEVAQDAAGQHARLVHRGHVGPHRPAARCARRPPARPDALHLRLPGAARPRARPGRRRVVHRGRSTTASAASRPTRPPVRRRRRALRHYQIPSACSVDEPELVPHADAHVEPALPGARPPRAGLVHRVRRPASSGCLDPDAGRSGTTAGMREIDAAATTTSAASRYPRTWPSTGRNGLLDRRVRRRRRHRPTATAPSPTGAPGGCSARPRGAASPTRRSSTPPATCGSSRPPRPGHAREGRQRRRDPAGRRARDRGDAPRDGLDHRPARGRPGRRERPPQRRGRRPARGRRRPRRGRASRPGRDGAPPGDRVTVQPHGAHPHPPLSSPSLPERQRGDRRPASTAPRSPRRAPRRQVEVAGPTASAGPDQRRRRPLLACPGRAAARCAGRSPRRAPAGRTVASPRCRPAARAGPGHAAEPNPAAHARRPRRPRRRRRPTPADRRPASATRVPARHWLVRRKRPALLGLTAARLKACLGPARAPRQGAVRRFAAGSRLSCAAAASRRFDAPRAGLDAAVRRTLGVGASATRRGAVAPGRSTGGGRPARRPRSRADRVADVRVSVRSGRVARIAVTLRSRGDLDAAGRRLLRRSG